MTRQTAAIPAEDFARRYLSGALCGRFIAAGDDLSFGQYGKGDAKLLQGLSAELEFEVKTISKVEIEGIPASSTYVRSLVESGKMEETSVFLGEPYCIDGMVVHGRHLGHELGFPTINLLPQEEKLLPPFGVYASKVRIDGKLYCGITDIGRKPTVDGNAGLTGVETNLFDFDGDLYGREVQVYLHHFQRPERKFENVDALKRQIALDVEKCKELLE